MANRLQTIKIDEIDQIEAEYQRHGVVGVRGVYSTTEVEAIRDELRRYMSDELPNRPDDACTYEADGVTVRNLWRLEVHCPQFLPFVLREELSQLAGRLVGGEPILAAVETFNKPARIGSAVPYHQDNAYFCRTPPDMFTIWIAIDPVTHENGPVYYVRGSHREMLPTRPSGVQGNSMGLAFPPKSPPSEEYCGLLEPGDVLIHHCQSIHRSEPNVSDHSRLAVLLVYRGAHTETDPELKANYLAANQRS